MKSKSRDSRSGLSFSEQLTVADLVKFCQDRGIDPSLAVLLLRQPCSTGHDDHEFLVNPQTTTSAGALDMQDTHVCPDVAITLDSLDLHFWEQEERT